MTRKEQFLKITSAMTPCEKTAEKFAVHLEELFDFLVPEKIGEDFAAVVKNEDYAGAIRLCAAHYRSKQSNFALDRLGHDPEKNKDFDTTAADKAVAGYMREVNVDWHFPDGVHLDPAGKPKKNVKQAILSATYLGVRDDLPIQEAVVDALRAGRTYLTLGPVLELTAEQNGKTFAIADVMANGTCTVRVNVSTAERRHVWEQFGVEPEIVRIVGRAGTWELPVADGGTVFEALPVDGWLRAEVYGRKSGKDGQLLANTSPIYAE
jgi:hypothetical protein